MRWNLAYLNRAAAERELKAKGKSLKDYPWPEDAAPEYAGNRLPTAAVLDFRPYVVEEHDHGQFQYCRCNPNRNKGN
jgi:hypothetical protein